MGKKQAYYCCTCNSLTEKLRSARARHDAKEAAIAYDQMKRHLSVVKYPAKHGFRKEVELK